MRCRYTSANTRPEVKLTTETVHVLKIIAEKTSQLDVASNIALDALKIDRIRAELREVSDHLTPGKVVKQGMVHSEIIYVGPDHALKYCSEDTPFILTVEIPGFTPNDFSDIQNFILDITPSYTLQPPEGEAGLAILQLKVAARVLIKVAEWTKLDVVTQVDVFPRQH